MHRWKCSAAADPMRVSSAATVCVPTPALMEEIARAKHNDGKIDAAELLRIIQRAQELHAVTSGTVVSACREANGNTGSSPVYTTNNQKGA